MDVSAAKFRGKLIRTYSTGMKRRVEIARALMGRPKVLFLDEPTRGLDLPAKRDMWSLLRRLAATESVTTFLSSHDAQEIRSLCSEISVIARGRLVHTGPGGGGGGRRVLFVVFLFVVGLFPKPRSPPAASFASEKEGGGGGGRGGGWWGAHFLGGKIGGGDGVFFFFFSTALKPPSWKGPPKNVQPGKEKGRPPRSLSAVSEAPPSEELGVETLCRGASDTAA